MKYILVFGLLLCLTACASHNRVSMPKYKTVFITEHPTKGKYSLELGKKVIKPEAYETDFVACTEDVYKKGATVNGELTTDFEKLKKYEDDALEASMSAVTAMLLNKRVKDNAGKYDESDRIIKERLSCMKKIGWVKRTEKVLIVN